MQKYQDVVVKASGDVVPFATVTVQAFPSGTAATIYSDNGVTTQTNPITCDANGFFSFYADDGRYQLVISGTGITTKTVTDIILDDYISNLSFTPTNVLASWQGTANSYAQLAVQNKSSGTLASTDLALYADNTIADTSGFLDIGITSSGNADPVYSVAGQNDSYIFASARSGASKTGNLVLATDNTGTGNEVRMFTNGFTQAQTAYKFRLDSLGNIYQKPPATPPTLTVNGDMVFNLTSNTNLRISVRGSDGVTRVANITLA